MYRALMIKTKQAQSQRGLRLLFSYSRSFTTLSHQEFGRPHMDHLR